MRKKNALEPEVRQMQERIWADSASSASISAYTIYHLNRAVASLKREFATNLWNILDFAAPQIGDNFQTSLHLLKTTSGTYKMTPSGTWVNGDYAEIDGLHGGGIISDYILTGFTSARAANDQSWHVYNNVLGTGNGISAFINADNYIGSTHGYTAFGGVILAQAVSRNNLVSASNGPADSKNYNKGVLVNTGAVGTVAPNAQMRLMASTLAGYFVSTAGRVGGVYYGGYMTPTQAGQFNTVISRLNKAIHLQNAASTRTPNLGVGNVYFGDSIVFNTALWVDDYNTSLSDGSVHNAGISSSTLQINGNATNGYARYVADVISLFPYRLIINYGVNDSFNYSGIDTVAKFEEYYNLMMSDIILNYNFPKERILLCSPYASSDAAYGLYGTGNSRLNQRAYRDAVQRVCRKWSVKYAAVMEAMEAAGAAAGTGLSDGIHPIDNGVQCTAIIGAVQAAALLS